MSEDCVGKLCVVCKKPIEGANFFCPRCKACICFVCVGEFMREVEITNPKCPKCGTKLK